MKIPAILWDGDKKIQGNLYITELSLDYVLTDFEKTNLELSLKYDEIQDVKYFELYDIEVKGLEITSKSGRKNIFFTKETTQIRNRIIEKIQSKQP